jgi:hypothetical protein
MGKDKRDKMILALVIVVLVLLAVLGYIFLIKPAISGFVVSNQNEGVQYAILSIVQQASTCKTVSLPVGNQTMDIIWVKCLQQTATPTTTSTK